MSYAPEHFVDNDIPPIDTVEQETIKKTINQNKEKAELVLKSVSRIPNTNDYIDNLVMFKKDENTLYGYLRMPGEAKAETAVMGFINQRKPDPKTGELKPSFVLLRTPSKEDNKTKWNDVGFINPLNHRKDGKDIYFDQLLVNIQHEGKTVVYSARTAKNLDPKLHEALGFLKPAIPRQNFADKSEAKPASEASKAETPDPEASAKRKRSKPRAK